jgi:hypothetical protein
MRKMWRNSSRLIDVLPMDAGWRMGYAEWSQCCAGEAMTALRKQLVLLAFVMFVACANNPIAPNSANLVPAWLTALTHEVEAQPVANPPALIARYDYKGQSVYFLPQQCCDIMGVLYRADGSVMCRPDGGLTGRGDGQCDDFFVERKNERIIWRDARGPRGLL